MKKIFVSIMMFVLISLSGKAQEGAFESWSAGINAGLYGAGIQGATSLSSHFKLRAGFDYFTYNQQDVAEFEVDVEYSETQQTATAELTDLEVTLPNFKVLVDYYPMKNGIFCLTGGVYFGNNKASTNGLIRDYQELSEQLGESPYLRYEDIVITPNDDGSFFGELGMGNGIKPYIGIGLGRTIPHNRVGFKFELGMVYQGKYTLTSPNMNEAGNDWLDGFIDEMELPVSESILNWWPMLNLSLTYRIR
ncbi:MAG: hypothetical protein WCR50_02765 [Proteiniphilum sp.]|jgi:hypothetical protein|nr:hypothetical protein [Proteiniphilum sp.]NCB25497.1 hypothetical protein [Bacteroidia bacterium]MDD2937839.1 hypothetical protein [Proteiniphilum sp.]MDD3075131.1 hypothetical protein [Proteiniphilum sp.]MDD3779752.1 hypothetical protein [Proteiniphilum sp.]